MDGIVDCECEEFCYSRVDVEKGIFDSCIKGSRLLFVGGLSEE